MTLLQIQMPGAHKEPTTKQREEDHTQVQAGCPMPSPERRHAVDFVAMFAVQGLGGLCPVVRGPRVGR